MRPYPSKTYFLRASHFLGKILLLIWLAWPAMADAQCTRQIRQYASSSEKSGNVGNETDAVDGNVTTPSTLTAGLLTPAKQWLGFQQKVNGGTRVYLKVSTFSGFLALLPSFTIQGYYNGTGGTKVNIATEKLDDPQLLGLVNGTATMELSFVPSQNFDGVVITVNGIGIAYSMKVYEAYYYKNTNSSIACNGVVDVLSGVIPALNIVGIGSVTNEWNAVDADLTSAAVLNMGVNAAGSVYETVVFNTASVPGDSVRIMIERQGGSLLDLLLLGNFSIQPYLGSTPVGSPITSAATGLQLRLLAPGSPVNILTAAIAGSFDRVEIKLNAVAGVLLTLKLLDVTRIARQPSVSFTLNGSAGPNPVCITQVSGISLSVNSPESCATYRWYNGTTFIGTGNSITPVITTPGNYTFNVEAQRTGCTNSETQASATVNVMPKAASPALTIQNNP